MTKQERSRRETVASLMFISAAAALSALAVPTVALWLVLLGLCCAATAMLVLTARRAPSSLTKVLLIGGLMGVLFVLLIVGTVL